MKTFMSFGLSLAGGGMKGAAHIGVIKALEEQNIHIDYISGTSSGSIIAGMYAMGYTTDEMYEIFKNYSKKLNYISIFNILKLIYGIVIEKKIIIRALNNGKMLKKIINEVCQNKNIKCISEVKMPLLIPSVDLNSGTVCVFTSRNYRTSYSNNIVYKSDINLCDAIYASCTYPGVFEPSQFGNMYLLDGGMRENIPWKETKAMGADKVLSVVFKTDIKTPKERNIINIVSGAIGLLSHELANYEIIGTDYLLEIPTKDISLLNSKEVDNLYNIGYESAKTYIMNNL